jgi:hypothetical protein
LEACAFEQKEKTMARWRIAANPLVTGCIIGFAFGAINLLVTWLDTLLDDSPLTLFAFYGPMFFLWSVVAYRTARHSGRALAGVTAGTVVAFATFVVYDIVILLRVNMFLNELAGRADWVNLVRRFRDSGSDSFRRFVNVEYITGSPLKIAVASMLGAAIGAISGFFGRRRIIPPQLVSRT